MVLFFSDIHTNTESDRIGSDSRSDPNLCLPHNPMGGWAGVERGWGHPPLELEWGRGEGEILNLIFGLPISTFGKT